MGLEHNPTRLLGLLKPGFLATHRTLTYSPTTVIRVTKAFLLRGTLGRIDRFYQTIRIAPGREFLPLVPNDRPRIGADR